MLTSHLGKTEAICGCLIHKNPNKRDLFHFFVKCERGNVISESVLFFE